MDHIPQKCLQTLTQLDFAAGLASISQMNMVGFRITPGPKAGQTTKEREAFADYQGQISALINTFGRLRAKELELRTTITYVSHMMESSDESATSRVPGIVRQLKPHFSELEIEKAAEELKRNGVIKW